MSINLYFCRSFNNPSPPQRVLSNALSSLQSALQESLKAGLIRNCKFNLEFRGDVFMYLFNGKGRKYKKGFMYDRSDFVDTFFRMIFLFFVISLVSVVL